MNVFKEMALSVYSYESYGKFLKNRKGKVFGFGALLMLIYFLITMFLPPIINGGSIFGLEQEFREIVPEFELRNGTLWVENVIEIEEDDMFILIDTDPDYVFYDADDIEMVQSLRGYRTALLMDSEKIIIKNNGEIQGAYFSQLDFDFDKEALIEFVPWLYVGYFLFMLIAYIWMTALFFFGVLFVALIAMIIASCMKSQLTFGQLYLMGIYSRTLPLIIKAAVSFLPFNIPFFWVINFGLSLFIIAMAIRKMNDQKPDAQKPADVNAYYI